MTKTEKIITISAVASSLICVALIIAFFNRMKQTVQHIIKKSYFTIDELSASDTARKYSIDNTPTPAVRQNLQALIDHVLDPAREELGSYIRVNSGYRSPALNARVGGVSNSQHVTGEAADITAGSLQKNRQLFEILVRQGNYDQLIWEKSQWIHVSYSSTRQRGQILAYNGSSYTNIANNWQTAIA